MTHKRNTKGLKPFKKGQSGNPLGGQLHDPEIKAIKHLTKQELAEIGSIVVKGDMAALRAVAADPSSSVLKCMIAGVAIRTISKGDPTALDALLNRLIGKVPTPLEHSGIPEGMAPQIILNIPANGSEKK